MVKNLKKHELAARAAWMYYIGGLTQHQIAEVLGVSRQVAQRLVAAATGLELVHVNIHHEVAECSLLASQLAQRFGLRRCQVVPSAGLPAEAINRMIAVTAAEEMALFINKEEAQIIALGSGRTLSQAVKEMAEISRPQHSCLSLIGAIASDGSCTHYDVPLSMAEKTSSKYFILPAPLFADSPQDREVWCNHRIYKLLYNKARLADVSFCGIGQVAPQCPLHTDGFITSADVERLVSAGAVAEIIGHFIDQDGAPVSDRLDGRRTSLPVTPAPDRQFTAFVGGPEKFQAVQAVLRGKWINGLVTDEETAQRLLLNP
ncbi:sugar-binding transcriptional regulator [Paramixta manurensis]